MLEERTDGEKKAYFEGYKQSYEHFKHLVLRHKQRHIALDKMEHQVELLRTVIYKEGAE